jgi:hypothetical protein
MTQKNEARRKYLQTETRASREVYIANEQKLTEIVRKKEKLDK